MEKTIQIRNFITDFLVFTTQNNQNSIEVRIPSGTVWLIQTIWQNYLIVLLIILVYIKKYLNLKNWIKIQLPRNPRQLLQIKKYKGIFLESSKQNSWTYC